MKYIKLVSWLTHYMAVRGNTCSNSREVTGLCMFVYFHGFNFNQFFNKSLIKIKKGCLKANILIGSVKIVTDGNFNKSSNKKVSCCCWRSFSLWKKSKGKGFPKIRKQYVLGSRQHALWQCLRGWALLCPKLALVAHSSTSAIICQNPGICQIQDGTAGQSSVTPTRSFQAEDLIRLHRAGQVSGSC